MTWAKIKQLRSLIVGNKCEVCGQEGCLVGHHVVPRRVFHQLKDEQKLALCRLRHPECEKEMHQTHPFGNTKQDYRIAKAILKGA